MASVTHITREAHQPRGGYIKLDRFEERAFEDTLPLHGDYSIAPGTLGTTVDYLSRALLGFSVKKAFAVALTGASALGKREAQAAEDLANQLQDAITSDELSDDDIRNALKLARYDAAYRAGSEAFNAHADSDVDDKTISDIRTLVKRTLSFFEGCGPVVDVGVTFEGGYSDELDSGDADLITGDTLWDLKTSKDKPSPSDTLQLAVYYLLSLKSPKEEFESITKLGIYNPRLNKSWVINVLDLDENVLDLIQTDLLGYAKTTRDRVKWSDQPSTTVYYVIDWIRDTATSESDKGTKFERASRYYLKNDPLYAARFSDVWMWKDAPTNNGHDIGIDLVAQDAEDGSYWAIQCKCYDENSTLDYKTVSTFFGATGNSGTYAHNMLISTTENLTPNLEKVMNDWDTVRIFPGDMDQAGIDWQPFVEGKEVAEREVFEPLPHQDLAIADCVDGFKTSDRGKLIMACGTGKTLTALRLTERLIGPGGLILFLAPSIALVGQSMRAWVNQSKLPMRVAVVCSDEKASLVDGDTWETSLRDLPYPATTDPDSLVSQVGADKALDDGLTVIFSTYQSIQVISDAQKAGLDPFDLIVCDEAHRTTGAQEAGASNDEISEFVKVHSNEIVSARKRLYMTATPRIYGERVKKAAKSDDYIVASMDDESVFGPEFHRLTFGQAVDAGLLTDYKVVALTVSESMVDAVYQLAMAGDTGFEIPDAAKIIGCWKGLLNQGREETGHRLKNAVAFCSTIAESKRIAQFFTKTVASYIKYEREDKGTDLPEFYCDIEHVDGTMNAKDRKEKLAWLADVDGERCRILSNARCLAEGVDVPNLDAVLFLQPKKSQIDIVQAVGRVMRKFEGKDYGYIILPIVIPAGMTALEALDASESYAAVWQVLKALRSHDERLDATINALPYDKNSKGEGPIEIIDIGFSGGGTDGDGPGEQQSIDFSQEELQEAVNAVIVKKCGSKIYWDVWAQDIAAIAKRHIARIGEIVRTENPAREQFEAFLQGLRDSLNESVTENQAVEMLAQHVITLPVFEALFGGGFAGSNPVSVAMEDMIRVLRRYQLETPEEKRELEELYDSVRIRAEGVKTDAGRQQIIKDLYENFFRYAFKATSDAMGVVYTPTQVVRYILHFTNRMLQKEFGQTFADKDVHILDPFTGTGTFIVDLVEDEGLIPTEALPYKYAHEIHCNEILLLAYYIATINIETAYHNRMGGEYVPFEGAVLTDTFQMYEAGDPIDVEMFVDNTERVLHQMDIKDLRVIIGNPPYSSGQNNANDNNANESYPTLDKRIAHTYAAQTDATNKNSLYDSYIRSFRWASDRIGDRGIITFVSNAGWVRSEAASGMRKCLREEFNSIYVFDLRGNARTQGEQRRKEKDNVFGQGTRTPITITTLIKNPDSEEHGVIRYHDIGDYLSREDKLSIVGACIEDVTFDWGIIEPDKHNDWLDQRDDSYYEFAPMGLDNKPGKTPCGLFECYSRGLETGRDNWVFSFSRQQLENRASKMVTTYNHEIDVYQSSGESDVTKAVTLDEQHIKWTSSLFSACKRGVRAAYNKEDIMAAAYRPYCKQWVYRDELFIHRMGLWKYILPSGTENNIVIAISGTNAPYPFSAVAYSVAPSLTTYAGNGACFPLYWYEVSEGAGGMFSSEGKSKRHDGITDEALSVFRSVYPTVYARRAKKHGGPQITKEDIFFYIYGILHSSEYRSRFDANLKKELPRIPLARSFDAFASAGRALADLHLNYETADMYPLEASGDEGRAGPVAKMKWGKKTDSETKKKVDDHSVLIYNKNLTFRGIPATVDRYVVNGRTPLEWIVDRYQVKIDPASGIVNDPNEYSDDPMYIINLVKRLVTVSVRTVEIMDSLPPINELPQTANWPFAWGRVENDAAGSGITPHAQADVSAMEATVGVRVGRKRRRDLTENMESLPVFDEVDE